MRFSGPVNKRKLNQVAIVFWAIFRASSQCYHLGNAYTANLLPRRQSLPIWKVTSHVRTHNVIYFIDGMVNRLQGKRTGRGVRELRVQRLETDLSTFKEEDGYLAQVEVNEMSCLVRHIAAKIASNDAMPRRVEFLIEFLFDVCGDILQI